MFTWYQETCFTTAAAPFSSARSNKDPTRTNLKKTNTRFFKQHNKTLGSSTRFIFSS